jgi:cytochrome c553
MKHILLAVISAALMLNLAFCAKDTPNQTPADINKAAANADLVKRGEYLVSIIGCDDCHTPKKMTEHGPEPDMSHRLMGHPAQELYTSDEEKSKLIKEQQVAIMSPGLTAFAGLWGVSYAANLTPDDTGTANWTEAQFFKAIREGKSKGMDGTRPLLPPMPWQMYRNIKDEDLRAIFAFIKSLPPVKNVVPNPLPLGKG